MKVAIVTTDGKTVSQHFGRSPYFKIFTIENAQIVDEQMRERGTGHVAQTRENEAHAFAHHGHHGQCSEGHGRGKHEQKAHGYGPDADSKHTAMAAEIADCDILVAGGMGRGAYESFSRAGLKVILTDAINIEDVVKGLLDGSLQNLATARVD